MVQAVAEKKYLIDTMEMAIDFFISAFLGALGGLGG
jgi:hypothetical protein